MTEVEQRILETLIELERAAKALPTANPKPDLQRLFARLDDLAGQLPKGTDPNLRHYLQRKSYEKARLLLSAAAQK